MIDAAVLHFDRISAGEECDYVKFIQKVLAKNRRVKCGIH